MTAAEQRKLENQLIVMGLKGLNDPELVPQLARLVPDHKFLTSLINECAQEKRSEMFEAIRPHLKFKAYPLDWYINQLKMRAQIAESRDNPIVCGNKTLRQVAQQEATGCVVELRCWKCRKTQTFYGSTPVCAMIDARKVGWVRDIARNHEACPKHAKVLVN